ncbi:hypothetical protein B4U80_14261 [Leptotrombidium deliense]|uniref:C-type lectin domain-containing protein n=1 Tax=Leptotrombidium deliense TaxID=299467 RepID=A0A443RZ35_9ACAR|nr:hypothetical protein B4U80_14261 [Leptotrombidium deliense]
MLTNKSVFEYKANEAVEESIKTLFNGFSTANQIQKNFSKHTFENEYKRYEVYTVKMTFNNAKEVCFERGGSLVEISNEIENDIVTQHLLFNNKYWIGAKRMIGRNMEYVNWEASEPKITEKDNCVNLINGRMHTDNCGEMFDFISENKDYASKPYDDVIFGEIMRENKRFSKELKEAKKFIYVQWQIIRIFLINIIKTRQI